VRRFLTAHGRTVAKFGHPPVRIGAVAADITLVPQALSVYQTVIGIMSLYGWPSATAPIQRGCWPVVGVQEVIFTERAAAFLRVKQSSCRSDPMEVCSCFV
jgi:hypothetical protein